MLDPKTMLIGQSRLVAAQVYFLDKQGREVRPIFQKDIETGEHSYRVYPDGGNKKTKDYKVPTHDELVWYARQGYSIRCLLPDGESSNRSLNSRDIAELIVCVEPACPSYWWVNHKQTYQAELQGGYIWSPKANKNGARNQTYENLTQVQPGDVVISYADSLVKAIGVATSRCIEAQKPAEFGLAGDNWSDNGWLVPMEWTVLSEPLSPKAHIDRIVHLLPAKHSPLQANGNGNQGCYLAAIPPELGKTILGLAGHHNLPAVQVIEDLEVDTQSDAIQQAIEKDDHIPETEKQQLIRSRLGQGVFRQRVLALEPRCRLTGVNDQSFLVASHIKPWKDCGNAERLDGRNGLMLAPHVDKLFDRGWISFENTGDLLVAEQALPVLAAWGLNPDANVGPFASDQHAYLDYHRQKVFKR